VTHSEYPDLNDPAQPMLDETTGGPPLIDRQHLAPRRSKCRVHKCSNSGRPVRLAERRWRYRAGHTSWTEWYSVHSSASRARSSFPKNPFNPNSR